MPYRTMAFSGDVQSFKKWLDSFVYIFKEDALVSNIAYYEELAFGSETKEE